jgi:hypothetical protein
LYWINTTECRPPAVCFHVINRFDVEHLRVSSVHLWCTCYTSARQWMLLAYAQYNVHLWLSARARSGGARRQCEYEI